MTELIMSLRAALPPLTPFSFLSKLFGQK